MEHSIKQDKNKGIILIISILIISYFTFLIITYLIPHNSIEKISFVMILGFIILISVFYNFSLQDFKKKKEPIEFVFISEKLIKLILIIFMVTSLMIKPISGNIAIILWKNINIFNVLRATSFIIGAAFVPGACIYSIFFEKSKIYSEFNIQHYVFKFTIYPLLSFMFIGTIVMIFDYFQFINNNFEFFLFAIIFILYLIDLFLKKSKINDSNFKKYKIPRPSLNIIFLVLGVILVAFGVQISVEYLIPGDAWVVLNPAINIGDPSKLSTYNFNYPPFWGQFIFGFSKLTGLPYMNTNALLFPFCYLFIATQYLFVKAILINFKEKYTILSVILISLFSGLVILLPFTGFSGIGNISNLLFVGEFYFRHTSYAFAMLFFTISLIIILIKKKNQILKRFYNRLIVMCSLFLVFCYMTYMFTVIVGFVFPLLFILGSSKKKSAFLLYLKMIILFILLFIIFDIFMNFYLSFLFSYEILVTYNFNLFNQIMNYSSTTYLILLVVLILSIILYFTFLIRRKHSHLKFVKYSNLKIKPIHVFIILAGVISILIEIELISILKLINPKLRLFFYNSTQTNLFFFYLDLILVNIGFIGILSMYLLYYCYKIDRKLFYTLILWSFFPIFISVVFWFIGNMFDNNLDVLFSEADFSLASWTLSKFWYYSIPPLCIITSIGIINLAHILRKTKSKFLKKAKLNKKIFKILTVSLIITLSSSNLFVSGMYWGNSDRQLMDEELEMLGWLSENLEKDSNILTEIYLYRAIRYIGGALNTYYFSSIFRFTDNISLESYGKHKINSILKTNKMQYYIHYNYSFLEKNVYDNRITKFYYSLNPNISSFIENILISNFYNKTLFRIKDKITLYYAPYFD